MAGQRGFTLLEMLVVMVLLGLVTSLALPAMQRWHDAVQHKAQAAAIIDALRAAGFNAGANRRDIVIDAASFQPAGAPAASGGASAASLGGSPSRAGVERAADARATASPGSAIDTPVEKVRHWTIELPAGWATERVDDIRFLSNGLCQPGSVLLRTGRNEALRIVVHGPLCGVELAADTGTATP